MSYSFAISALPIPDDEDAAWQYVENLIANQDGDAQPNPAYLDVIRKLTAVYPCISELNDDELDDPIWSDGPLIDNAGHSVTVLGLSTRTVDEVLPKIIEVVVSCDLALLDFQSGQIYRPSHRFQSKRPDVPPEYAEVADIYRPAMRGNAYSQGLLAALFEGKGSIPQNYELASLWHRKAAEQGAVHSQYSLGLMYAAGRGVPLDDFEAVRWFRAAAEQGSPDAQRNLGRVYAEGRGVPQDNALAITWTKAAADQGDDGAKRNLAILLAKAPAKDDGDSAVAKMGSWLARILGSK